MALSLRSAGLPLAKRSTDWRWNARRTARVVIASRRAHFKGARFSSKRSNISESKVCSLSQLDHKVATLTATVSVLSNPSDGFRHLEIQFIIGYPKVHAGRRTFKQDHTCLAGTELLNTFARRRSQAHVGRDR